MRPPRRWWARALVAVAGVSAPLAILAAVQAGCGGGGEGERSATERPSQASVDFPLQGWKTDFSRHSVPLREFHSGGPPRDGIPPIDRPRFVSVRGADLPGPEPVVALTVGDDARAYPLRILIWHEIANDVVGGEPVAVTFCPLCHTAVVFSRRLDDRVLSFGTTGNLRFSDLVMWDRQTESWWQQFSGEAVVGALTGRRLPQLPAQLVSFTEFRARHPAGRVLSEQTGFSRPYGQNPYVGYDDADSPPFLFRDRAPDGRLAPKARVVAVDSGRALTVVPFADLARRPVVNERAGGLAVVVWWRPGTASALSSPLIQGGSDVGSAVVYERRVAGRTLTFRSAGALLADRETGSRWNRSGRAVSGPLAGERLRPVPHDTPFWFAVAAFRPDARISRAGASP